METVDLPEAQQDPVLSRAYQHRPSTSNWESEKASLKVLHAVQVPTVSAQSRHLSQGAFTHVAGGKAPLWLLNHSRSPTWIQLTKSLSIKAVTGP